MKYIILTILMALGLSACETVTVESYQVSPKTQSMLKLVLPEGGYDVDIFITNDPRRINLSCDGSQAIELPDTADPIEYIKSAFVQELQTIGKYEPGSKRVFNAIIDDVRAEFSGELASWVMAGRLYKGKELFVTTEETYNFNTGTFLNKKCEDAAEEFPAAVAMFLESMVSNIEFKKIWVK